MRWYTFTEWNHELTNYFEAKVESPCGQDFLMKEKDDHVPMDITQLEINYGCSMVEYHHSENTKAKLLGVIGVTVEKHLRPRWLDKKWVPDYEIRIHDKVKNVMQEYLTFK